MYSAADPYAIAKTIVMDVNAAAMAAAFRVVFRMPIASWLLEKMSVIFIVCYFDVMSYSISKSLLSGLCSFHRCRSRHCSSSVISSYSRSVT